MVILLCYTGDWYFAWPLKTVSSIFSFLLLQTEARADWHLPSVWKGISALSFYSISQFPHLFFDLDLLLFLSCPFSASSLFSWLLLGKWCQYLLLRLIRHRLFRTAHVFIFWLARRQEIRWSVEYKACCHMPLVFAVIHLFYIWMFWGYCFCLFLYTIWF